MNADVTVVLDSVAWRAWFDTDPDGMPRPNVSRNGIFVFVLWYCMTLFGRTSQPIPDELTVALREALNGHQR